MHEPQAMPQRWKPLTDEQIDDMVGAFNELQMTDHFAAIIGQSGNIAVEVRENVIDPDTLAFILDVADRHQLRPYIFRTEHNAPIVLQPLREPAEPSPGVDQPEGDVVPIRDPAGIGELEDVLPDAELLEPAAAEEQSPVRVTQLPNAVMLTVAIEGLDEEDWPVAQFTFETTAERELAQEVAEQAGQLAAARITAGIAPAHALAEAHEVGLRAIEKAKTTLVVDA